MSKTEEPQIKSIFQRIMTMSRDSLTLFPAGALTPMLDMKPWINFPLKMSKNIIYWRASRNAQGWPVQVCDEKYSFLF